LKHVNYLFPASSLIKTLIVVKMYEKNSGINRIFSQFSFPLKRKYSISIPIHLWKLSDMVQSVMYR